MNSPKLTIEKYLKSVTLYEKGLIDSMRQILYRFRQLLERYLKSLDGLSPLNVLKRGYSITRLLPSYQLVKESGMITPGDEINVVLEKGEVFCKVEKIKE